MGNSFLNSKKKNERSSSFNLSYNNFIIGLILSLLLFYSEDISAQNCTVNAGINQTVCENASGFTLSGSATGLISSAPVWSQISGPSVIIDDPSDLNTSITGMTGGNVYGFRLSATCTDGTNQFQDVLVTIESITIADAGNNIESCPDSSGALVITGNTPVNAGETGRWSIEGSNRAGVTIDFPNSATTTIRLAESNGGVSTLRWTITGSEFSPGNNCESFSEITVTNFGGEDPVDAGPNQVLDNCYTVTQSTSLNGSFGGSGINGQQGTWSFVSGPSTPVIGNPNNNTTGVSNLSEGVYVFRWSVSGPCVNGEDTMSITVPAATQDITRASVAQNNIRFCDTNITTTTLVGAVPEFAGETVQWTQTQGPPVTILDPNNSTTQITGLNGSSTYRFLYTITNTNTGCNDSASVLIRYSNDPISIIANGGDDIIAQCGVTEVTIPFTTTGSGSNTFSIISGPPGSAIVNPGSFRNTNNPLRIDFDVEGTYTVLLRRRVSGSIQTGCDEATDAINVTIALLPTPANAGTGQNLACDVTSTSLTGNIITTGTSLWTQISGPNTATIDDPFARTTNISNLVPGIYTFRYIISGGSTQCAQEESDVQVVVSSSSSVVTDAGPDQTVCFGTPIGLAANDPPSDNLIGTWSVITAPVGASIVFDDINDPNTFVSGLDTPNSSYVFQWTITNPNDNSCPTPGTDSVTINTNGTQGPSLANAGNDQCLPSGTTVVNLSGSAPIAGEQGIWTAVPNTGISFADATQFDTQATIAVEDSYILTWTISNITPGCQSTSDEVEITVGDDAIADAGPDQSDCVNVFTMAATATNGDGIWTQVSGPGGFTIDDDTSPTAQFTFAFSGQYVFQWTVNNGSCSSDSDQITINAGLPPTTATVGADQEICDLTTPVTLSGNSFDVNTENGVWTLLSGAPNTPTISDVNDPLATVSGLTTGSYTFRWTISGEPSCPSTFADLTIDVFEPANAGADQLLCEADNTILEAAFGSTGTWIQVSGPGISGQPGTPAIISQTPANSNVAEVTIVPGNTYVFRFTTDYSAVSGCSDTFDEVTVTTSNGPSIDPNAGTDQILCIGDLIPANTTTLNGNTPPVDVDTAIWRFASQPAGSVAVIDSPNNPASTLSNLSVPGIYILEWNFEVDNCTDAADVVRIEVFEAPSIANAGVDQTNACQLSTQLNAVVPTAGIGTWSFANPADDPSGGAVVIDNPNSPTTTLSNIITLGTYTLTWTVTNGTTFSNPSACAPSTDTVDITFTNDVPSTADAGPDQLFCDATQTNLNAVPLTVGTGTWTQTAGPGITDPGTAATITAPNNPQALILGLTVGTYEFTWTTENGGCSFNDTMQVVIQSQPLTAEAGPNQTVEEFSPITLGATPVTVGTGTWSQVSGPTSVNFIDENLATTPITGTTVGDYVFQWTVSNGICNDVFDTVAVTVVGIADLELSKNVNPVSANPGDVVTFTISIFNNDANGASDASGVSVFDAIPAGYTLVPGSVNNGGVFNAGDLSITWSNLNITNGTTLDLSFQATVNASGPYLNTAEIIASDQFDPDSTVNNNDPVEDDQDTAEVTIQSADLSLNKTVSPTTVSIGETVTFTLAIANSGTETATGVSVQDVLPDGYTVVAINNGGVQSGNTITWSGLTIPTGPATSVSFTAIVNASTGAANEYLNIAQITASDVPDPDSTPNNDDGDQSEDDEDSAAITLEQADLELSKSVNPTSGNAGEVVTFTISIFNNDAVETGNATGVSVQDVIPNGFTLVPGTVSNGGVFNGGSNVINWSNLSIANGATLNLTFDATVNATGTYTNNAQITASDLNDPDSTPNNDDGDQSEDDEDNATFTIESSDLSLVKGISTGSSATPNVGETIIFEITVTNSGGDTATNVSVTDEVPPGFTIGTVNNGGVVIGDFISWDIASLPVGSTTLSYEVTVNVPTGVAEEYVNIAEITASDQFDPDSTPNNDDGDQSEDDEDFFVITPQTADLSLEKTISDANPNVGDIVTFTINLSNGGANPATGVNVSDALPAGFGNITAISNGGVQVGNRINWTGLSVAIGSNTTSLTFNAEVLAPTGTPGEHTNVAEITSSDQADPDSSPNNDDGDQSEDDEDNVTATIQQSDLSLEKTASTSTPNVGDVVTYTITITNAGPDVATGVNVSDIIPSGLGNITSVSNGGIQTGNTINWTGLSVLANNGSVSLTYQATVNAPTGAANEYLNVAEITASDQFDPDSDPNNDDGDQSEDDEANFELTPESADLSITKAIINGSITPNIGDVLTFELTIANAGTHNATGVSVRDILPVGLTLTAVNSGGNQAGNTALWTGLFVPVNGSISLTYQATVNAPTGAANEYLNAAEITASDQFDPDSDPSTGIGTDDLGDTVADDDETSLTVVPQTTDLSLTKSVNNTNPEVGETITFTIQINNSGAVAATNVTIADVIPSGYTIVNGSVSNGGIFNAGGSEVLWNLANVPLAGVTLTYQAIVNAPTGTVGEYNNTAQITASDQFDPDSTPNNDDGDQSEDDEDNATVIPRAADLSLVKGISAGSSATPNVGETITFEITVTNSGGDTATNVSVTDEVPPGFTIGTVNNGGVVIGDFISWDIASLPVGSTTLSYGVTVNAPTGVAEEYVNIAEITASDQFDPDSTPNNDDGDQSEDDEDFFVITPQTADLSLEKTISDANPNVGDIVTFTINLSNGGANPATGVNVSDALPAGFGNITAISNGGVQVGNRINWTGLSVAIGSNTTSLTFNAEVLAPTGTPGEHTNVAEITSSDQADPDSSPNNDDGDQSEDDEDNVTATIQQSDLSLEKTASTSTPNVGDVVTYTITITNAGPDVATGVNVSDIIPSGLGNITSVSNGGIQTGNTINWTGLSVLANNGSVSLTYQATVNAPTGAANEYLNVAEITASDQFDPDSDPDTGNTVDEDGNGNGDDDDEDTFVITPLQGDLSLTKIVVDNDITPLVGTEISYEITVRNDGPNDATNVVVRDQLPSGLDFVLFSSTSGTYNETTGIWNVGSVSSGGTQTLIIDALVNPTGNYTNGAEVIASDVFDIDSTPNNNILAEDDQDEVTITPINVADLSLTKGVDNQTPDVATNVTFTITVTNDGPSDATGVVVTDQLPSGYSYVSDDAAGGYNETNGIWNIGNLASGASITINIVALVNTTGDYTNVAEITSLDQTDIDSTPGNNLIAEDDQDEATTIPRALVDLSVTKVANTLTPDVGGQIQFTVTVINDGPSDATNVVVTDLLASGYAFVNAVPSVGTYEPLNGSWTIGNLANGVTQNIVITANVLANGIYTNTAELTDLTEFDVDSEPANNDDTEDDQETINPTPVLVSDLSLVKTVNNTTPQVGETVEFTINVTNDGPSDVSGVVVTDQLPSGYTFISNTATAGDYDATTGIWNLNGVLPNGTTETLRITVLVNPTGDYTNTAEITASGNNDPDSTPGNNDPLEDDQDDAITNPIPIADLSLVKTVDNQFPDVSDNVTFTITLTNDGPSEATGIVVTDILESGYNYISDTSGGAYNSVSGLWSVGNLASGASISLDITVSINTTGSYNNVAEVTAVNELDPDSTPGNNDLNEDDQDEQNTLPRVITDISVTKTVDNLSPSVGSQITFTVTVTNDGPSDATGLVIEDVIASGYQFVSATPSAGTYDEIIGSWDVSSLTNGVSETLQVTVTVLPNGEYANIAELIALDTFDPDSSPDNNLNSEDDQDTVTPVPTGLADLSITKEVNISTPNVGDIVEFTINVTNSGNSNATGVIITDQLPQGYTYQSHVTTAGIYNPTTGLWNTNGTILNGATETLIILAEVNAPTGSANEYLNIAQITASDQADPDSDANSDENSDDLNDGIADDDEASALVIPQVADLNLNKTVSNETPNVGDVITFTIAIENNGPDTATGVAVRDILPLGYSNIANVSDSGNISSNIIDWNNLTVPVSGLTLSYEVTVNMPTGTAGEYLNIAEIVASDQFDPNSNPDNDDGDQDEDDEDNETIVSPSVDIGLQKVVDNPNPNIGDQVIFTITASNSGSIGATNISIDEALPGGYQFVSSTASLGTYDELNGEWIIPSLASQATATLNITVTVLETNDYLNIVSLSFLDQIDLNTDNDSAQATVEPTCLIIYNEFSPNGDGVNDFFQIDCISRFPNNKLEVYNRWGNIVFEQRNYDNTWDGTSNGRATINTDRQLPVGTYYYILDLGDGSQPRAGWLYINR
ncbi:DUF11 domain-containing protein [Flavobacteriaceae bacterium R38]|nr:DUF11 domain-containing protein [Flavobacteriaceae bacterium R38]